MRLSSRIVARIPVARVPLVLGAALFVLTACAGVSSDERTALIEELREQGIGAGVPESVVTCLIDQTDEFSDVQLKSIVDNTADDATGRRAAELLAGCQGVSP